MLIVNGTLLLPGYRLLERGAVRFLEGLIAEVGPTPLLVQRFPLDERLDAHECLVLPGLVCAHSHLSSVYVRGLAPLSTPPTRRERTPSIPPTPSVPPTPSAQPTLNPRPRVAAALGYDELRYGALLGCIEAIRAGVTTCLDQLGAGPSALALDAQAEACTEAGLRACLLQAVNDERGPTAARQAVDENARFARRVKGEATLCASMGLGMSAALSDETLRQAVGAAALADVGYHVELAAGAGEVRDSLARHGLRSVERLRRYGVLGPRTVLAPARALNLDEVDQAHKARAALAHLPSQDLRESSERLPLATLLEHGASVCLGCDDGPLDVWRELRLVAQVQRAGQGAPWSISGPQVLALALGNGAELASRVFRQRLGVLEAGACADIILVEPPGLAPCDAASLPWHLTDIGAAHVDTTIVAGRVLMRHRTLTTLDEEAVRARARELSQGVWARVS